MFVEDTGPGLPQVLQDRINSSEKSKSHHNPGFIIDNNSGIGLLMVKELPALLNIHIRVSAEPGRGTRYEVLLKAVRDGETIN